jgi:glycosyltransferase involved in cell wall biosynthesis
MSHHTEHGRSSLVSVVIPAYNVEEYVGDAIRSAFSQTYRHLEVICVDDGSTDGTLDAIQSHEAVSQCPFSVISTANRGPSAARAEGTRAARGEWIQYLDSDDMLDPEKIESQMRDIRAAGEAADVHITSYRQIELDGRETFVRVDERVDPLIALYFSRAGITTSMLWRREAIERVGGWDEQMPSSEEMDLLFRILASGGKARFLNQAVSLRRMRPGSVTTGNSERMWRHVARLRARVFEHLLDSRPASVDDAMRLRMLRLIQRVHDFDPGEATELQRRTLGQDYDPPVTRIRALPYVAAYRNVGFMRTEAWRRRWPRLFVRP